jgi:hypothetical protein
LHDQQGRSEQMDGLTNEDRSSDNTTRTVLDARKTCFIFGFTFLMMSWIFLIYCGKCEFFDICTHEDVPKRREETTHRRGIIVQKLYSGNCPSILVMSCIWIFFLLYRVFSLSSLFLLFVIYFHVLLLFPLGHSPLLSLSFVDVWAQFFQICDRYDWLIDWYVDR